MSPVSTHSEAQAARAGQGRARWRRLAITIAAIAGVAVAAALGRWQLARAAEKLAVHDAIQQRQALPVLDADALAVAGASSAPALPSDPRIHRRIVLHGRWLPRYTVYLDNRQMDGRPGFFVLTPLQVAPAMAVLVQRGWVPRDFIDRARLPTVLTPDGDVTVEGRLALPPSQLYAFADDKPGPGSSAIRQNLDLSSYRRETGLPLAALSVLQSGEASEGLQRRWPAIASGVEKHYGYAVQWFGLAALIAILYVWFQIIRRTPFGRRRDSA